MTVVTSTWRHSTKGAKQDPCHQRQPYNAHNTLLIGQYGVRIVTYFSVVRLWFTLRASASAAVPELPILFHALPSRLWKEYSRVRASSENQLMGPSVRFNIGLCRHYQSVELENVSAAIAIINPERQMIPV